MKKFKTQPKEICDNLINKAFEENFYGFDPYDLKGHPFFFLIQNNFGKIGCALSDNLNLNFPIFLRKILNIKKKQNCKALALFLSGCCNLYKKTNNEKYLQYSLDLYDLIIKNKSKKTNNLSFGYPFNWHSNKKNKFQKDTPNIVVSSFVGMAFMDLYEITKKEKYLTDSESIANFILNDLNKYKDNRGICFSYTIKDNNRVHNANMLGAEFLSKISKINGKYEKTIIKILNFFLSDMNKDYSWNYFDNYQKKNTLIDNYHTAFIICSYYNIVNNLNLDKRKHFKTLKKAILFYKNNLFVDEIPIFSTYKKYPIDIHSCANSIRCFNLTKEIINFEEFLNKIIDFTNKYFFDYKRKYYFYRIYKFKDLKENNLLLIHRIQKKLILKTIDKSKYIRWNDAWMFYALTELL
jgi:hypothetical protein